MFIFLYGEDTYRSAEKLQQIKEKFKKEIDPSGINIITFTAADFDLDKFSSAAAQTGFLVAKRLIIVKDLLLGKLSKSAGEPLLELLERLKKSDNVFIFWEGGKPDMRTVLFKLLAADKKFSQNFERLDGTALNAWLKDYVKKNNGRISHGAVNLLASFVGNNLWQLKNELNKLLAYKNGPLGGQEIGETDVKTFVIAKINENIFNLTDAISAGHQAKGLKLLEEQLSAELNEIYILAMLTRQFRILAQLASLASKNLSEAEMVRQTKLHPFIVKKTLPLAKKFSLEKIKGIYRRLVDVEKKFKSTSLSPRALLDLLVMKI